MTEPKRQNRALRAGDNLRGTAKEHVDKSIRGVGTLCCLDAHRRFASMTQDSFFPLFTMLCLALWNTRRLRLEPGGSCTLVASRLAPRHDGKRRVMNEILRAMLFSMQTRVLQIKLSVLDRGKAERLETMQRAFTEAARLHLEAAYRLPKPSVPRTRRRGLEHRSRHPARVQARMRSCCASCR